MVPLPCFTSLLPCHYGTDIVSCKPYSASIVAEPWSSFSQEQGVKTGRLAHLPHVERRTQSLATVRTGEIWEKIDKSCSFRLHTPRRHPRRKGIGLSFQGGVGICEETVERKAAQADRAVPAKTRGGRQPRSIGLCVCLRMFLM